MSDRPRAAIVTGGTDGIDKAIARKLVSAGIATIIIGRDARKGRDAERELRSATKTPMFNSSKRIWA